MIRRAGVVLISIVVGLGVLALPAKSLPPGPHPIAISASGTNGSVTATSADGSCPSGTEIRRLIDSTSLSPGSFSALGSQLEVDLRVATSPGSGLVASLYGTESRVTLRNERGGLAIALTSGSCDQPTLNSDGVNVAGSGTWSVVPDQDPSSAYRNASGSGTFTLTAALDPGSDRPWALTLSGAVTVLQPNLVVSARAFWGNFGLDYLSRVVSVRYTVANSGPGDAFAVRLVDAPTATAGVVALGPVPQTLGDIPAGRSAAAVVRYRLRLNSPPCKLLVLGCRFTTTGQVASTDALDDGGDAIHPFTVVVPPGPIG